jgi:hypothetical protein
MKKKKPEYYPDKFYKVTFVALGKDVPVILDVLKSIKEIKLYYKELMYEQLFGQHDNKT